MYTDVKITASQGFSPPAPLPPNVPPFSLYPAVHHVLPSSQQFVYGTLFAKLIFPPFKCEPASGREGERERERAQECESEAGSCSSWKGARKRNLLREVRLVL